MKSNCAQLAGTRTTLFRTLKNSLAFRLLLIPFFLFLLDGNVQSPRLLAWQINPLDQANEEQHQSQPPLTLQDCYELALKQSEQIALRSEVIKEAEARFVQSFSGILPKVSFFLSETRRGLPDGSTLNKRRPEDSFSFSQPLFSGFKEFAAMAASRAERRQRERERARAEQLLFLDVSDAFYLYLLYQEDMDTLQTIKKALDDRLSELSKREELGRTRPSELASSEVRLKRIEAEIELIASQKDVSRQLLEFLTGSPIIAIEDLSDGHEVNQPVEDFIQNLENRPDIQALKEALTVNQKGVTVARAGFFPNASLDGNYYTRRPDSSEDIDWDVTFTVEVPIFQGGENLGKTKEAQSLVRQAELRLSEARRNADLEVRNSFTRWQTALRRSHSLEEAMTAAERNFLLQTEDYRLTLVSNLDVLQALEDLQNSRREFIAVKNEEKRLYWQLLMTAGDMPNDTF